jgi:hypothetical protein
MEIILGVREGKGIRVKRGRTKEGECVDVCDIR